MKESARRILIAILVIIAVGCTGYLAWYYGRVDKGEASYKRTGKIVSEESDTDDLQTPEKAQPDIPVDFAKLQAVNPEVYAWITIPGTGVDYPVVQSQADEEYYLDRTWDKTEAPQGAIFTQTYNNKDFKDYNTVIYGHRAGVGDASMFHDVLNYMDAEYMKEHQDIVIYTEAHKYSYKVFAAIVYDDRLIPTAFDFSMEEGRQNFLDSVYASGDLRSQFADDVEVALDDRIITLSTCLESEPDCRYLLEAVLVNEE